MIVYIVFESENAESYEYLARGQDNSFKNEDEQDAYYENALENSAWEEISEEEFNAKQGGF